MKKSAYLINLTGGKAIKEEHLVLALRENWIAGAVLNALPRQPLPLDSELWGLPNVIITPRIAGFTPKRWHRLIPVFQNNLRKFSPASRFRSLIKSWVTNAMYRRFA